MNGHIVVFGEALIDLYSHLVEPQHRETQLFQYEGVLGGAPSNVAVHLARLGIPVSLIASFADDPPGDELRRSLGEWGVDLTCSKVHDRSRTPIAMVSVTPRGNRTFRLYLGGSAAALLTPDMLDDRALIGAEWFHFGSVLLPFPGPRDVTLYLLRESRKRGIVTSYDVNVRSQLWAGGGANRRIMLDVMNWVDVLKLSDEDFEWLANEVDGSLKEPRDLFRYGCPIIAYTAGPAGATVMTPNSEVAFPAPDVEVVDTTGAGDAFMAGLIAGLRAAGLRRRSDFDGKSAARSDPAQGTGQGPGQGPEVGSDPGPAPGFDSELDPDSGPAPDLGLQSLQRAGRCATELAASVLTQHGAMPRKQPERSGEPTSKEEPTA